MRSISKKCLTAVSVAAWVVVLVGGMFMTTDRDTRPGPSGAAPSDWPADTALALASDRSSVFLFAHPECPCTRASLRELERVVARTRELANVQVVLCVPAGAPADFAQTDLKKQAESIRGVSVWIDVASLEARRFGARTSGEVLAFGPDGVLRFHGGITGSRGHEGDNAGSSALLAAVREAPASASSSPVFGCALFDDEPTPSAPSLSSTAYR
jgi:hypothetical protein